MLALNPQNSYNFLVSIFLVFILVCILRESERESLTLDGGTQFLIYGVKS